MEFKISPNQNLIKIEASSTSNFNLGYAKMVLSVSAFCH